MTIEFTIYIKPLPQERPRINNGRTYYSKEHYNYREIIAYEAKRVMGDRLPLDVPVAITLDFFKDCEVTNARYGDVDNLAKSVLDAMNKIVYKDDRLIYHLIVNKIEDESERIEIYIDY